MDIIEKKIGRPVTQEDEFLLTLERESVQKAIDKIEDAAKFMVGSISTVTGIFTAAQTLFKFGPEVQEHYRILWPLLIWCIAILVAMLALLPLPHRYKKRTPLSIEAAYRRIMWMKWWILLTSVVLFSLGAMLLTYLY